MSKYLFIILIGFISYSIQAANSSLFYYNVEALQEDFKDINELENYIILNNSTTLSILETNNSSILKNLNLNSNSPFSPNSSFTEIDWGAFMWGFCCPYGCGVMIVAMQKDSRTEERLVSAIKGMAATYVIIIITYAVQISRILTDQY